MFTRACVAAVAVALWCAGVCAPVAIAQQTGGVPKEIKALQDQIAALQALVETQAGLMTVTADCTAGGSVASAFQAAAGHVGPLTIRVKGVCHETVAITRSDVTIVGVTQDAAIMPAGPADGAIQVSFATNFTLSDIALTNTAGNGLSADAATVALVNVSASHNGGFGILARNGSRLSLTNVTVESNAQNGIHCWTCTLQVRGGSISDNTQDGVQVVGGSGFFSQQVTLARNGWRGVAASVGASLFFGKATIEHNVGEGILVTGASSLLGGWTDRPATIQDNGSHGIILSDTSVAQANGVGSFLIQSNAGAGVACSLTPGAPAAQVGRVAGFSVSGNAGGQINCPSSQ